MAATQPHAGGSTITCPTCNHTVNCQTGNNRTICPQCGNFYSRDEAGRPPPPRRLTRDQQALPNLEKDKNKQGSALNSLANFFQNLGPNKKNKNNRQLSPTHSQGSNSSTELLTPKTTELPPIGGQGHLTAPNSRPVSYNKEVKNDGRNFLTPSNFDHSNGKNRLSPNPFQNKLNYPVRTKTIEQIRDDIRFAKDSGNWKVVQDFYATTFDSFLEINAVFKRDPNKEYCTLEEPGLKFDLINFVFDLLPNLPQEIQKGVLKSTINSLLKDKKPHTKDDLRAYLVLLHNPQFENTTTYVIFAHLLRQIAALSDHEHHFLVHWMRKFKTENFSRILRRLQNFITQRLFPTKHQDLPPMAKCTWWIPSATKVTALLNAANNLCNPLIVPISEFYNTSLDYLDLMSEYYTWQNPSSCAGFSFCQYPFILSITAKKTILQKDSEQQMIIMARGVQFSCGICEGSQYVFTKKYLAKRHLLEQHSGFGWKCEDCKGVFNRSNSKHKCTKENYMPKMTLVKRINMSSGEAVEAEYNQFLRDSLVNILTIAGKSDRENIRSLSHTKTEKRKRAESWEMPEEKRQQVLKEIEMGGNQKLQTDEREKLKEKQEKGKRQKENWEKKREKLAQKREKLEKEKREKLEKEKREKLEKEKREKLEKEGQEKQPEDKRVVIDDMLEVNVQEEIEFMERERSRGRTRTLSSSSSSSSGSSRSGSSSSRSSSRSSSNSSRKSRSRKSSRSSSDRSSSSSSRRSNNTNISRSRSRSISSYIECSKEVRTTEITDMQSTQDKRILVNIGGKKFQTSAVTLDAVPGSLLYKVIQKDGIKPYNINGIYTYFIDRDSSHFKFILNYYRNKTRVCMDTLPREIHFLRELQMEANFYQLPHFHDVLERRICEIKGLK